MIWVKKSKSNELHIRKEIGTKKQQSPYLRSYIVITADWKILYIINNSSCKGPQTTLSYLQEIWSANQNTKRWKKKYQQQTKTETRQQ